MSNTTGQKDTRGRPEIKPEELEGLLAKLEPYLKMGLSVSRACEEANLSKSTIFYFMDKYEHFLDRIETYKNFMSTIVNNVLVNEVHDIVKKQAQLQALPEKNEEGEIVNRSLSSGDRSYMQWFATTHHTTRREYNPRLEVSDHDPQREVHRIIKAAEEYGHDDIDVGETPENSDRLKNEQDIKEDIKEDTQKET